MRRHLIPILMICSLIGIIVYGIMNTTLIANLAIPHFIRTHYRDFRLESFYVRRQSFQLPDRIILYDVGFTLKRSDKSYQVRLQELSIYDIVGYEANRRNLRMSATGLNVQGDGLLAQNFNARLILATQGAIVTRTDGILQGTIFEFQGYRLQNLEARFKSDGKKLQIYEVTTQGYGGQGRGQFTWERKPQVSVILWLELYGMDAQKLQPIHAGLFSQISGTVDGTFRLIRGPEGIDLFAVTFSFPSGGELKLGLVQELRPFFDDPEKYDIAQRILSQRGSLPVEKGTLYIQNSEREELITMFSLESKGAGLQLRGTRNFQLKDNLTKFLFPEL
jgi:hypothetical protein